MAVMRFRDRFHPLKLVFPLGGIVLWLYSGCAAKKADIPPPPPSQVQPQAPGTYSPPPIPGQSPAQRGNVPRATPPSARDAGKPPADPGSGPMFVHKVRYPGESVSIIAGWYTGEIENWKVLAEANPGLDPNVIHAGMKINIPESMMKTREPMTKEYVDSFYPKQKSRSKGTGSRGQSSTPADEETPLFGPKQ